MNKQNLDKWAELLLDTGKRNNLVNFRDVRAATVDVLKPDFATLFDKADNSATLEVFIPGPLDEQGNIRRRRKGEDLDCELTPDGMPTRDKYIEMYAPRLKKSNQILIYNPFANPLVALRNIGKRARSAMEETGVNIAYLALGFVNWHEGRGEGQQFRAPVLLCPITVENNSPVDPYYIRFADDIVLNPTFAFKMQSEYGVKLPEYKDESATNYLKKIAALVRRLGWTVSPEAKIGVFSFLKINMYRDIMDNADAIINNVNVRALNGEAVEFASSTPPQNTAAQDRDMPQPDFADDIADSRYELHNVVDADSSQAAAVRMARAGRSFVLQGPPGTGKSQTITNIISECLASGKKVLFVSEKLAALNVVFDKLKDAGLSEFCLELHSHKANKKDVIEELCTTLRLGKTSVSSRAADETAAKLNAQTQLDNYAEELHKQRKVIDKSLYELFEIVSSLRNTTDFPCKMPDLTDRGTDYVNAVCQYMSQLAQYQPTVGYDYRQNVWYGYRNTETGYQATFAVRNRLLAVQQLCTLLNKLSAQLTDMYRIAVNSISDAEKYRKFFKAMGRTKAFTPELLDLDVIDQTLGLLRQMKQAAEAIVAASAELDAEHDQTVYKLDGTELHKKLTLRHTNGFGRLFSSDYGKILRSVAACRTDRKKPKYAQAVRTAELLATVQQQGAVFTELQKQLGDRIACYNGQSTDWDGVIAELTDAREFMQGLDFGSMPHMSKQAFAAKKDEFNNLAGWLDAAFSDEADITRLADDFDETQFDLTHVTLAATYAKANNCLNATDQLDNWCRFRRLTDKLTELAAMDFVNAAIDARLPLADLANIFRKQFYTLWIDKVIADCPTLSQLSRIPHDKLVETYAEKDRLQFEINKAQVKAILSAQRPDTSMIPPRSQISVLLREGEKKRKQKPVRQLLAETWQLTQTLKPCFLMSPLSVSTFLGPEMTFDVVVFDEASQIFPQDAVGAIYRGKQLIVVGDGQQMPPSNFFNTVADSDEDANEDDDITDFESILDLCSTALPQLRLKWHYRSRFEQLIAFSNKNYYDNDLVTFPAAERNRKGFGVDYYYVDSVFDRTSRTNRAEAEYVVDLIFDNIKRFPARSLGVVTFSVSQQDLVDKLLTKRRQADPSHDDFFRADKPEPFFIKNLETVQGDERDTIILDVAYGKDVQGKLLHNFGPLNRAGGERRLNVAVTRAKYNVQVVSGMRATDIDLTKTQSRGVRLLRDYLDYAENGTAALTRTRKTNPFERVDLDFEAEVAEFLRKKGFDVETNVGCSDFRVDIAVRLPRSNTYAIAIECDGASYHATSAARDRDRLRKDILERMGWHYYRVWSTDWFRNKSIEQDRLVEAVAQAVSKAKSNAAVTAVSSRDNFEMAVPQKQLQLPVYVYADVNDLIDKYGSDFRQFVKAVLAVEAPISEDIFVKRIVRVFGREKVTQAVNDEWTKRMRGCAKDGIIRKKGFLYLAEHPEYRLRTPAEGEKQRNVADIAIEELAAGIVEVVRHFVAVDKTQLYNFIAQQLGYTRAGDAMTARLNEAFATVKKLFVIDDNVVSLK